MNNRIRELAEQAGYPDCMTYGQDLVLERFAELIAEECKRINIAALAELKRDTDLNGVAGWNTMMNLAEVTCRNKINETFGL